MTEIRCNLCGSKFDEWDRQEDFGIHRHVGYGSKYDLSVIELDFCCSCFDKVVDYIRENGAIDPVVSEYE